MRHEDSSADDARVPASGPRDARGGHAMSGGPLVSVITIFLNAEAFIQEAIESVFAQTCTDWELVLVDDGSTDRSSAIALDYAHRHPAKVRYADHARHQNRGMSASRNLGIASARGELIALLDADDVWLPPKLERQAAILRAHPEAAMVYGATEYWHSWTGNPDDRLRDDVPDLGVQTNTLLRPPALLKLASPLGEAITPCPSDLMFRREVAERIGGFEESFRGIYEDRAFLAKVYLNEPVFVAGECWDRYRVHPDSCVSVLQAGQHRAARLFFLNWLEAYLSDQGVDDPEIWKALDRALWPARHPVLHRLRGYGRTYIRQMRGFLRPG